MKGLNQKTGINPLINQVIASALGNTCAELENPCELIRLITDELYPNSTRERPLNTTYCDRSELLVRCFHLPKGSRLPTISDTFRKTDHLTFTPLQTKLYIYTTPCFSC